MRSGLDLFENFQDQIDLGAFQSAATIGIDAVLDMPQCIEPRFKLTVRVSICTVTQVPRVRIESRPENIEQFQDAGHIVVGIILVEGSISLDRLVAEDH